MYLALLTISPRTLLHIYWPCSYDLTFGDGDGPEEKKVDVSSTFIGNIFRSVPTYILVPLYLVPSTFSTLL